MSGQETRTPRFARITVLQFLPEKAEEGFDIVQHSIVPSIKQQRGCQGLLLLRDPNTGSAITVTLSESEAAMVATATGNYPVQIAKLSDLLAGPPTRDSYEVREISL